MENIIQDQKQMINYLHKQAAEHVKTREMLIQMNEELEKEIIDKDEVMIKVKKELETKENIFHDLKEENYEKETLIQSLQVKRRILYLV